MSLPDVFPLPSALLHCIIPQWFERLNIFPTKQWVLSSGWEWQAKLLCQVCHSTGRSTSITETAIRILGDMENGKLIVNLVQIHQSSCIEQDWLECVSRFQKNDKIFLNVASFTCYTSAKTCSEDFFKLHFEGTLQANKRLLPSW